MRRRLLPVAIFGMILGAIAPLSVVANMAAPNHPGQPIGEPSGELVDLHIEREDLAIDLRPLVEAKPVGVRATYHVRNDGEQRSVDLVFVATALKSTGGVWIDGAAVPVQTDQTGSGFQPPAGVPWQAPTQTPGETGRLGYSVTYNGTLRFTLDIPPGQHDIAVQYAAEASQVSADNRARYWQVGYVLSPARQWASFGTLDVAVQLPADWYFASEPALTRDGGDAHGTFAGVPADSLALTTRFPAVVSTPLGKPTLWLAFGIAAIVGLLIAVLGGRYLGRRGRSGSGVWPVALVYSALAGLVAVVLGNSLGKDIEVPTNQVAWTYGYADLFNGIAGFVTLLLLVPLFMLVATIGMTLASALVARSSRPTRPIARA
jgi:hypothetical protein